jgi:hypothetical protein
MRLCLAAALLAGCATGSAVRYDQVVDQRATELDAKIQTFLDALDRAASPAEGAYRTNWHFYVECLAETDTLRRRAQAAGHLEIARSLDEVAKALESLRRAHDSQNGVLDRAVVQQIRPVLRDAFDAIYKIALRGEPG